MKTSTLLLSSSFGILAFAGCVQPPLALIHPEIPDVGQCRTTQEATRPDPLDEASRRLLLAAEGRIAQLPTDGVFGLSRVPTFHGTRALIDETVGEDGLAAYNLLSNHHAVVLNSFGEFDKTGAPQRMRYIPIQRLQPVEGRPDPKALQELQELAPQSAAQLMASKGDSLIVRLPSNVKAVIELKKVYSSNNKCQSCHAEVGTGKPVGIIAVTRVPSLPDIPPPATESGHGGG